MSTVYIKYNRIKPTVRKIENVNGVNYWTDTLGNERIKIKTPNFMIDVRKSEVRKLLFST